MTFRVRRAGPTDAEAVAVVHVDGWRWGYRGLLPAEFLDGLEVERRADRWREILAGDERSGAVFVAESDGRTVGFVGCGPARSGSGSAAGSREGGGEIYAIYLEEGAAGTGAGKALLERAVAELRERGHGDAILWVLESNARARRFYEREGWRRDGAAKTEVMDGVVLREVRYRLPRTGSASGRKPRERDPGDVRPSAGRTDVPSGR